MLYAGFELTDPSKELLQTDALDRKATRIVNKIKILHDNECVKHFSGMIW